MSSSRARTRFAVLATVVPLLAAGAYASPASAASVSVTQYPTIGAGNVVGPNAGFRNPAQGVRGNTAIFKLDVDSANASIDYVDLRLSGYSNGPAIVPSRDFAQTDGFALFKDVSAGANNTLGPADGVFDATDYAQGAVSTGYAMSSPSAGQIPVRIKADGVRATGSSRYFVTVHPSDSAGFTENRDFQLTIPEQGVRFGDATTSPSAAVQSPRLTIDSKPPVAPASTNFVAAPQPPFERQGATKVEDGYVVSNENNDPDKTLIFLNDGNNVAESNFIVRTNGAPVIEAAPTGTKTIFIGDGTGLTATSKAARNNQTSDSVFVRGFDTIGNLTAATRLFDNRNGTGDKADRSNDVTAPGVTGLTPTLNTGVRGINAANVAAVPTRNAYTSASGTNSHDRTWAMDARLVVSVGGVLDEAQATPWGTNAFTSADATSPIIVNVNATSVGTTGSQMRVQARAVDAFGNATDLANSANLYTKDVVLPVLSSVSFEEDNGAQGVGEQGDSIRIRWSEPMWKDSIGESGGASPVCANPINALCINNAVTFPDGGVDWGVNPTVKWSSDLTSVLVTLGPDNPQETVRLPQTNDKVRSTTQVQDPVGNTAAIPSGSDRFIAPTPPIAGLVKTGDLKAIHRNLYNQGRDGYLDQVEVTFPVPLDSLNEKLATNFENFKVIGSDVQTPNGYSVTNSSTFVLRFAGVIGSGETPRLEYTPPASGGLTASNVAVPHFSRIAVDYAPPAVQLVTTADRDADGKLDTMVAKYSEAINHTETDGDGQPDNYVVTGYQNQPDGTLGDCPAPGLIVDPWNSSTAGPTADVTYIAMCEKAQHDTAATPPARSQIAAVDLAKDAEGDAKPNTSSNVWSSGTSDNELTFNRVLDKAPPVVVSRTTRDLNSDGYLDAIDIVYGEALDAFSIENARYTVSDRSVTSVDILGTNGVRLILAQAAPGLTGDTATKPTVQYTGGPDGGLRDASDQRNPVRLDAAAVSTGDGAGPAITAACAGTATNNGKCPVDTAADDKMNVFFSEALAANQVQAGDFVVEQPAGSPKAVNSVVMAADNKSATLVFTNNAINPNTDATVRFLQANAVTDASTPAQGNTQTAAVTAPAPPAVTLNLTCPVAAAAGYCGATSVNTGAVATAGLVRFWRLSTTARTATTPDSEYSANQPSVYPPSGALPEGLLKLYLSGKDDFGRLSTEVSDDIEILRSPTLSGVNYLNATAPARGAWSKSDTVLDGDNVRVGATAYSSDVAKWTSNGACLAKHMSVDYKGLTGNAAHTAVAPFSCDLKSAPANRVMVFPFVKVSGTTKYPVGTVLKLSANDPGSLILDGPNGTQIRRQFVSVNARRSHMISDASVITVPLSVVNGISRGRSIGYRDGSVIKTSTSGYYYVYQSLKRPISGGLLAAWKMPTSQVYTVSTGELNAHATGAGFAFGAHPVGTWVRFADGSINQITKNQAGAVVRRGVTSSWALRTLVPSAQIYTANHYDRAIPYDASFMRGYRDGTLLKTGTNTYAVVSRTVLRTFANSQTFNSLGYNTANAWTFVSSAMPRTPTGYQTGAKIDRYKISSTVIKVTNLAGASATATVLPAINGLYGVGNVDPIPANWDTSRQ